LIDGLAEWLLTRKLGVFVWLSKLLEQSIYLVLDCFVSTPDFFPCSVLSRPHRPLSNVKLKGCDCIGWADTLCFLNSAKEPAGSHSPPAWRKVEMQFQIVSSQDILLIFCKG
jgi:hypothetical protein